MKAVDIMTSPVITATPETSVADAAHLMLRHRVSGVPVVTLPICSERLFKFQRPEPVMTTVALGLISSFPSRIN